MSDAASHASLVDACRLSRARVVVTPHRDVDAVAKALAERTEERALVLTDSVFSTDGALAPLRRLHEVCRGIVPCCSSMRPMALACGDRRAWAAARGRTGRAPDIVMTTTLSKAFGQPGAVWCWAPSRFAIT